MRPAPPHRARCRSPCRVPAVLYSSNIPYFRRTGGLRLADSDGRRGSRPATMSAWSESGVIAEVNGTRLAYEVAGDGPPVVLVHGFALDRRLWDDQVEAFAAQHRVVCYDLRGFGASADPRVGEDLRALLAHVGIRGGALVGLSLGGWVVLEFALTYPELVNALVLVDAVVRQYSFPRGGGANLQLVNQVARMSGLREAKELWLAEPVFERSREIPGVAARLRRMVEDYRGWQFLHDNPHTTMQPPALERLAEVAVPTLVIVGGRDHPDSLDWRGWSPRRSPGRACEDPGRGAHGQHGCAGSVRRDRAVLPRSGATRGLRWVSGSCGVPEVGLGCGPSGTPVTGTARSGGLRRPSLMGLCSAGCSQVLERRPQVLNRLVELAHARRP